MTSQTARIYQSNARHEAAVINRHLSHLRNLLREMPYPGSLVTDLEHVERLMRGVAEGVGQEDRWTEDGCEPVEESCKGCHRLCHPDELTARGLCPECDRDWQREACYA